MKRFLSLIISLMLVFTTGLPVAFADAPISITVKGQNQAYSVSPVIVNGRTLAPMEEIFPALGAEFEYDAEGKTITAKLDNYSVEMAVDSESAKGSRLKYTLDVTAQTVGNTTMVPVRFVAEQLGYKVGWTDETKTVSIEELKLYSTEPDSEAKKAAVARARDLTDFTFVPLKDITTATSKTAFTVFEAGKEQKGFPYSSAEITDTFVCENVSFETFLSALSNPDSVLYTKDLSEYKGSNGSTYYGIVCNGLVRYCLGITNRCNTYIWPQIPGMNEVYPKGEWTVDDLEICDIFHANGEGSNHVVIVTDILRDEEGNIAKVEVCEAVRTTCRRRLFTPEDLYRNFKTRYKVCRYEYIESIPPYDEEQHKLLFESGLDKKTPRVAVNYGDKSNYYYGQETVISVFEEGENVVEILRGDEVIEEIPVNGYTKLTRTFETGYYTVKLKGTDHSTEFSVNKVDATHEVNGKTITINVNLNDPESKLIHMEFRTKGNLFGELMKMVELTEEERASGQITREIPQDSGVYAGSYKLSFQNKYGIWTHKIINF